MIGIYKITNNINNHCYIGQSIHIEKRWQEHQTKYNWEREFKKPLYLAFQKYGLENFSFEVIEECQPNQLDVKEKYCSGNSLSWEMETVNAYLSADPFEDVYTGDWDKVTNKGKGYVGGVLISIKETTTKKGEKMCFLNISREDKIFDLVVFPRNYLEYKPLLKEGNCIVCKTEKQGDTKGIMQTCEPLKDFILRTRSLQKESVINRYVET